MTREIWYNKKGDIMLGLEYIRKLYGDTTITLADKLGITKSLISQWENGKKPIPKKRIEELSKLYNVSGEYFSKELTSLEQVKIMKNINGIQDDEDIYKEQIVEDMRKIMNENPAMVSFMEYLVLYLQDNKSDINKLIGKSLFEKFQNNNG